MLDANPKMKPSTARRNAAKFGPYIAGLALIALPVLVTWYDGTLFADGCRNRTFFLALKDHTSYEDSSCRSVPLSMDLPSLMIGLSSAFAIPLYYAIRRHLQTLDDRMRAIRLVGRKETAQIVDFAISLPRTTRTYVTAGATAVGLTLVALYFYNFVESQASWAELLHRRTAYRDPQFPAEGWWAAPHHELAQFTWVAVGWIGAAFALLQARLNYLLAARLRREDVPQTRYLRRNCDGQHGWAAFDHIFLLSLMGSFNFLLAIGPILYLLIGGETTAVAAVIAFTAALFGGVMCAALIIQFRAFVKRSYDTAWEARRVELEQIIKKQRGRRTTGARMDLDEMGAPGQFPLTGPWRRILQGIGVLVATTFLAIATFGGKWVLEALFR